MQFDKIVPFSLSLLRAQLREHLSLKHSDYATSVSAVFYFRRASVLGHQVNYIKSTLDRRQSRQATIFCFQWITALSICRSEGKLRQWQCVTQRIT